MSRIIVAVTIIGLITAGIALAAAIGVDIPKIATQQHVADHAAEEKIILDRLAGSVQDNKERSLQNAIEGFERRIGDLRVLEGQLKASGQDSRAVSDQMDRLRKDVESRERELNNLRN